MLITRRQIKAARSLLEWDAEVLANKAGLSRDTVFNIESGRTQARESSLHEIARVFDENGVEFTDNEGVKFKPKNIVTYEGQERFSEYYDFVYNYLHANGGDVCIGGVDNQYFSQYRPDRAMHRARMAALVKERKDVRVRILVKEGDERLFGAAYAEYRWQPKEYFYPTSYYAFGEYLALISFANEPPPLVVMIKSVAFAEAYRQLFNFAWDNAVEVPASMRGG